MNLTIWLTIAIAIIVPIAMVLFRRQVCFIATALDIEGYLNYIQKYLEENNDTGIN